MSRRIRRNRKMTSADITYVVEELHAFARRERGAKLTWQILESLSGFSRPALSSKVQITEAFVAAKLSIIGPRAAIPGSKKADSADVERMIAAEQRWHDEWQRIVFNARRLGIGLDELMRPLPALLRK